MTTTCETPGKHRANMITRRAGCTRPGRSAPARRFARRTAAARSAAAACAAKCAAPGRASAHRCPALNPCLHVSVLAKRFGSLSSKVEKVRRRDSSTVRLGRAGAVSTGRSLPLTTQQPAF